ncbi:MAG: hypothetical protein ABI843_15180 [Dokdonella sp.]
MKQVLVLLLLVLASSSAGAITPKTGIWWNPDESGRGYVLEVSGLTLVAAVYAYDQAGNALWYLASGSLTNNGADFQAPLYKYAGGQCITCDYTPAVPNGDDGTISIQFSSNTAGVVTLPGGRQVNIRPFFAPSMGGALGGLPISFGDIDMLQFGVEPHTESCEVKLTYRNSASTPITPFLYFDVLDEQSVSVGQLIFHTDDLAAGATAQGSGLVEPIAGAPSICEGFSLRFNQNASQLF